MKLVTMNVGGNPEDAQYLRDLADRVETGEVRDCVVVFDDHTEKCFKSFGIFSDRWRVLGALEYAKAQVHGN